MVSEREYDLIKSRIEGVELADSITVDGHKILNVVGSHACSRIP